MASLDVTNQTQLDQTQLDQIHKINKLITKIMIEESLKNTFSIEIEHMAEYNIEDLLLILGKKILLLNSLKSFKPDLDISNILSTSNSIYHNDTNKIYTTTTTRNETIAKTIKELDNFFYSNNLTNQEITSIKNKYLKYKQKYLALKQKY
jgi:hypothetical protein